MWYVYISSDSTNPNWFGDFHLVQASKHFHISISLRLRLLLNLHTHKPDKVKLGLKKSRSDNSSQLAGVRFSPVWFVL